MKLHSRCTTFFTSCPSSFVSRFFYSSGFWACKFPFPFSSSYLFFSRPLCFSPAAADSFYSSVAYVALFCLFSFSSSIYHFAAALAVCASQILLLFLLPMLFCISSFPASASASYVAAAYMVTYLLILFFSFFIWKANQFHWFLFFSSELLHGCMLTYSMQLDSLEM